MLVTAPEGEGLAYPATFGGTPPPQSPHQPLPSFSSATWQAQAGQLEPNNGSFPSPEDHVPWSSSDTPQVGSPENSNDRHISERGHITLLVVGPSGSGKSTFIASVSEASKAESKAMIGHGLDPCTLPAHVVVPIWAAQC